MSKCNYTELSNQELVRIVQENITSRLLPSSVKRFDSSLFDEIVFRTEFLDPIFNKKEENVPIRARLYCLSNNITEYPKCPREGCTNHATWWHYGKRFAHCCLRCSQMDYVTRDKYKNTCRIKYGVDNAFQSNEIKETIKRTMIERHGVENASQSKIIQDKKKLTCQKHYGVDVPLKSKDIRDKVRNTNRERYGGNAPMCSEHVKQKMRKTSEERYGGIGMASAELAQKTITKTIELYDKTPIQILHESSISISITKSKLEIELGEYIKAIYHGDVQFNVRSILQSKKELDIWIPERRIAIEFNGDYWHMNPKLYSESDYNSNIRMTAKQKWEYDELKINECQKMGIELIVVWEHDWVHDKEQVKESLQKRISGV